MTSSTRPTTAQSVLLLFVSIIVGVIVSNVTGVPFLGFAAFMVTGFASAIYQIYAKNINAPKHLKLIVLGVVIGGVGLIVSIAPSLRGTPVVEQQASSQNTPIPKIIQQPKTTEPKIGMDYETFYKLCGTTNDMSQYQSTRGTTYRLTFEYSDARSANSCWGTFTFHNSTLESIFRN